MGRFFSKASVFDSPLWEAATSSGGGQLPPVQTPKVKNKQISYPGFAVGKVPSGSALRREDAQLANTDILSYRNEPDTRKLILRLIQSNPDMSAAANAYLRIALTQGYKCWANNMDGTLNPEGTALAQELLLRWDLVPNYVEDGFTPSSSIRSVAETLALEMLHTGAHCCELVLDKARLPARISPIPVVDIKFYQDGPQGLRMVQMLAGEEIDLDFPTVFYTSIDQPTKTSYATSPFQSGIQPVFMDTDYSNDLRRVLKRAIQPRLQAIIDSEVAKNMIPPELANDPEGQAAWFESLKTSLEQMLNGLNPEDALVAYSMIEFSYVSGGKEDVPDVIQVIQELINGKMATGVKALPSILGHGSGSQNIASSETLMFMKSANGLIREKLNETFSKILTLAVRLTGQDVAVHFEYEPIELRPNGELEAFRVMRDTRVLTQLSYGFLTDEEASLQLTGKLPPPGFKPLSGTQFLQPQPASENPTSGTSNGGSGGGALQQANKSKTPKKAGGRSQ